MHPSTLSAIILAFASTVWCGLVPITTVDESSIAELKQGIDRLCNPLSFSDLFLINNENCSQESPFLSEFRFHRPLTVRDIHFTGTIEKETCFIAFITSNELSKVVKKHIEMFAIFIAVLPTTAKPSVRSSAKQADRCTMYYFSYDPVTLVGSWSIEKNGKSIYTLDDVGAGEVPRWNLRGENVKFFNIDPNRDTAHDVEIGRTLAKRHNGTFSVAMSYDCLDYVYTALYAKAIGSFAVLPESFQLCFMVPKSSPKSVFTILSDPFDYYSWGAFLFTMGTVSVLLSLFGESYRRYNAALVFLELAMNALNGPSHHFYGRFEVRLVGLFMMMNIVLLSCYQSLIISLMSTSRYDPEIDTIDQINDTCQFQRELFLQSMGYRFKNTIYHLQSYHSYRELWDAKMCMMILCGDLSTGHSLIQSQSGALEDDGESGLDQYYRLAKGRIRSSSVMYAVMRTSPVRGLIEWYTAVYTEGHLHHFPLLSARKNGVMKGSGHPSIVLLTMRPEDLMIVWIIFLIGCATSGMVFLLELMLTYVPKFFRKARVLFSKQFQKCKRTLKRKSSCEI